MEKDPEITGQEGSHYTAPFWEYDSRIGRRWNVDPVNKPWESSYLAFSGNPVLFSDPNGDNADWFQNEKTGEIFYHPEYREGDEDKIEGEGWVHLGENGMFGENDWSVIADSGYGEWDSDFEAVEENTTESGEGNIVWKENFKGVSFTAEESCEIMKEQDFELFPKAFYNYSFRLHLTSPTGPFGYTYKADETVITKVTYVPRETSNWLNKPTVLEDFDGFRHYTYNEREYYEPKFIDALFIKGIFPFFNLIDKNFEVGTDEKIYWGWENYPTDGKLNKYRGQE